MMTKQTIMNIAVQLVPGLMLGVGGFSIGIWLVEEHGWYPAIAAIPIYPVFAILLGLWLRFAFRAFGYGQDLTGNRFLKFLGGHALAFVVVDFFYWRALELMPTWNFQYVALPALTLVLLLSTLFNTWLLRHRVGK